MVQVLDSGDPFFIAREYDRIGGSLEVPVIKAIAEAMIADNTGVAKIAVEKLGVLVNEYRDQVGQESMMYFMMRYAVNLINVGYSEKAGELLDELLNVPAWEPFLDENSKQSAQGILKMAGAGFPTPVLSREEKEYTIPCRIVEFDHDLLTDDKPRFNLVVDGEVNGIRHQFLFDSGADTGFFISDSLASLMGCVYLIDSVNVSGTGTAYGRMGYVPEINIGGMIYRGLDAVIVPDDLFENTLLAIPVLGRRLMTLAGEFVIDTRRQQIHFPAEPSPWPGSGCNMAVISGQPMIEAYNKGERLVFHFDTGNAWMNLHRRYYDENTAYIKSHGEETTALGGGFGYMGEKTIYILPEFPLEIAGKEVLLREMPVDLEIVFAHQGSEHGALGMGLVTAVDRITVSFTGGFVAIE